MNPFSFSSYMIRFLLNPLPHIKPIFTSIFLQTLKYKSFLQTCHLKSRVAFTCSWFLHALFSLGDPFYRWPKLLSRHRRNSDSGSCCGSSVALQPAAHWSLAGGADTPSGGSCSSSSHTPPPGIWNHPDTWKVVQLKFKLHKQSL